MVYQFRSSSRSSPTRTRARSARSKSPRSIIVRRHEYAREHRPRRVRNSLDEFSRPLGATSRLHAYGFALPNIRGAANDTNRRSNQRINNRLASDPAEPRRDLLPRNEQRSPTRFCMGVHVSESEQVRDRPSPMTELVNDPYDYHPSPIDINDDDDDDDDNVWLRFLYPSNDASCSDARRNKSKEKDNAVMEFLYGRKSTRAKA